MRLVTIALNGRFYRLSCGAGQEARLRELADHLNQRIERLAMDSGQHGDDRLLVMAALLLTDELLELKALAHEPGAGENLPAAAKPAAAQPAPERIDTDAPRLDEAQPEAVPAQSPPPAERAPTEVTPAATAKAPPASSSVHSSLEARLAQAKAAARIAPHSKTGQA